MEGKEREEAEKTQGNPFTPGKMLEDFLGPFHAHISHSIFIHSSSELIYFYLLNDAKIKRKKESH